MAKSPCPIPAVASYLADEHSLSTPCPVHRLPLSTRPNPLNYGLKVCMIMALICIYTLPWSRSGGTSLIWIDHGLQVYPWKCSITTAKCISKLDPVWSPKSLDCVVLVYLQTLSIPAYKGIWKLALLRSPYSLNHCLTKCMSKLARLRPPGESPNMLGYILQTRSIMASKCIINLGQVWHPSSHNHGRQVHLHPCSITISGCIS